MGALLHSFVLLKRRFFFSFFYKLSTDFVILSWFAKLFSHSSVYHQSTPLHSPTLSVCCLRWESDISLWVCPYSITWLFDMLSLHPLSIYKAIAQSSFEKCPYWQKRIFWSCGIPVERLPKMTCLSSRGDDILQKNSQSEMCSYSYAMTRTNTRAILAVNS